MVANSKSDINLLLSVMGSAYTYNSGDLGIFYEILNKPNLDMSVLKAI